MSDKKIGITRLAGICGILIPVVVFTSILLALAGAPWFRWTNNALSELGVEGVSAFFFNNGLILGGILAFIFSIGLMRTLKKKTGAYILAASSLALIGVGLFAVISPIALAFSNGVAISEAIVCFPAFIWCMTYGFKMAVHV